MTHPINLLSRRAAASLLRRGAVGVFPTDTILGLVASALKPAAVERLYRLRRRPTHKASIILIGRRRDLAQFDLDLNSERRRFLRRYWPGPISIILPLTARGRARWSHLHRGGNTLAFRLPAERYLRQLLKISGPLVAPSANPAGQAPARTLAEAVAYFGPRLDFYARRAASSANRNRPSKIVDLTGKKPMVIRS